jgi:hypothetical protein
VKWAVKSGLKTVKMGSFYPILVGKRIFWVVAHQKHPFCPLFLPKWAGQTPFLAGQEGKSNEKDNSCPKSNEMTTFQQDNS